MHRPLVHLASTLALFAALACPLAHGRSEFLLSLPDLVAGHSGCSTLGSANGVSPRSGQVVPFDNFGGSGTTGAKFFTTDGTGNKADLPFVDGVFTIDGVSKIDSTGATFAFPATNGAFNWDALRDGIAAVDGNDYLIPIELSDQPGIVRGGLGVPGNAGITFDLKKIVAIYPGGVALRVEGLLGMTVAAVSSKVSLRVLVDGVERVATTFTKPGDYQKLVLPLPPNAHFLTFAAVDAQGTTDLDGAVVADLKLAIGGAFVDCNVNAVPDPCDLLLGTSKDCDLDGRPDDCEWRAEPYGFGHPGTLGFVPKATMSGCVLANGTLYYDLSEGYGGALAFVVVGTQSADIPTGYGPHLWIGDATPIVGVFKLGGAGPGKGVYTVLGVQQGVLLSNQSTYVQTFIADPFAAHGFSSTCGLEFRTLETN